MRVCGALFVHAGPLPRLRQLAHQLLVAHAHAGQAVGVPTAPAGVAGREGRFLRPPPPGGALLHHPFQGAIGKQWHIKPLRADRPGPRRRRPAPPPADRPQRPAHRRPGGPAGPLRPPARRSGRPRSPWAPPRR